MRIWKQIENRIAFKIVSYFYIHIHLELLTPKTMRLIGSTKNKITKD